MKIERSKNTINGSIWGIANRVVCTIMPFILRTVIIYILGTEYLGLNSLFTAILHVLNLSELGLSNAIVYHMYKPVARDDFDTLGALLNLYRKLYYIVGTIILLVGICCTPFLPTLIKNTYPNDINIYVLYLLFLLNTCSSYFFFAYKESILYAYQRVDIVNKIRLVTYLGTYGAQIIVLLISKNYYLYATIMIVFTIARCCIISFVVDKYFPQIKCKGSVSKDSIKSIKKVTFGAAIGKICAATRGSCDDIIISAFIGLTPLAIFDNYYYILSAIVSILYVIEQALSAGVGNSIVSETIEKNYKDFNQINFFFMWIVGWFSICLLCLYQPFMELWVGESLQFPNFTMVLFCVYFFSSGTSSIPSVYANARGLWWEMRYKSVSEVILNLVLNIIFVQIFGVNGILVATILTLFFISFIWGSDVLFKNYFSSYSLFSVVKNQLFYALTTTVVGALTLFICQLITMKSALIALLVRIPICVIVPNAIFMCLYYRTGYYQYGKKLIRRFFKRNESI